MVDRVECCMKTTRLIVITGLVMMIIWFGTSDDPDERYSTMLFFIIIIVVIFAPSRYEAIGRRVRIREFMREHSVINFNIPENRDGILAQIKGHIIPVPKNEIVGSDECVICLDDYDYDNNVGKLRCNHYYHQKCIERWLMEKTICPLCKYNVLSSNDDESLDDNPEPVDSEIPLQIMIR